MAIIAAIGAALIICAMACSWFMEMRAERAERDAELRRRKHADEAMQALSDAILREEDAARAAIMSLQKLPPILSDMQSPDAAVRRSAAERIAALGPNAYIAVYEVAKLLDDPDAGVREAARKTVLAILRSTRDGLLAEEQMCESSHRRMQELEADIPPRFAARYAELKRYELKRYREAAAILVEQYSKAAALAGKCGEKELEAHFRERAEAWKAKAGPPPSDEVERKEAGGAG
jgi:hypothetical protein